MIYNARLDKICKELDNVRDDILKNNYAKSSGVLECLLYDITKIRKLVEELDENNNDKFLYQKISNIIGSVISLIDRTIFLNNFKIIRYHLEMFMLE